MIGRIASRVAVCLMAAGVADAQETGQHSRPARSGETSITTLPSRPRPGSIVRVTMVGSQEQSDPIVGVSGSMAGEPLHFMSATGGRWRAIGGVPVDASDSVVVRAILTHVSGKLDTVLAKVTLPRPPATTAGRRRQLSVSSKFTQPPDAATEARISRESARARAVGRLSHGTPALWTARFLRPRESAITSRFGSGRLFNGSVTSRHLGVDFRGAVGEPVHAANRGVVALVDQFFLAGGVVYIDHGGGVVTGYFHLSRTIVAAGDTVERGQRIGLVGASGRVTGPHLHWSARYGEHAINPLDLIGLETEWYSGVSGR